MTRASVPGYLGRVLDGAGDPVGTCFQVTPGVLVTAWHVLNDLGAGRRGAEVAVDPLDAERAGGGTARVHALDEPRDLAVLICDQPLPDCVPGLVESDWLAPGVDIAVTGVSSVPGEQLRYSSTTGTWEGPAMTVTQVAMGQVKASGLAKAMSGAPVRRISDDRVVGVVSGRYNSGDGWLQHTVWVARVEDVTPLLTGLAQVPVTSGLPRGSARDLTLVVSGTSVRLTGAGVDVSAAHGGVRPGLANALHDVWRERSRQRMLSAKSDTATLRETGSMSLRRAGELLAESFLPPPVADALARILRQAEREHAPVRLGIDASELSTLPWEAMPEAVSRRPLALHPLVSVYRRGRAAAPTPLPGPLRVVVAISSPDVDGGPLLDYERELSSVLDAVQGARFGEAHVEVVPFATTQAIRAALDVGGVHVLHVSAHGKPGLLDLEDEDGRARPVTADQFLEEAIPAGKMPPVISLAACYTDAVAEKEGVSYAARLAERGACAVIATQTSVTDRYATLLFARVYAELARSEVPDVVRAVADARRAVQRDLTRADDPASRLLAGLDEWSVVTVLASEPSVVVLDRGKTTPVAQRRAPELDGLLARPVGQFVGRRAAQRHLPTILESDQFSGVLLHGIGGIGKTTLAAEVLRRTLERDGVWRVATVTGPASVDEIFTAVASVLRRDLYRRKVLDGPQARGVELAARMDVPWQERLAFLREDVFPETPVLLVLDNFEDNLARDDYGGWQVTDPMLAGLLASWVQAPGRGRLVITSRYPFPLPGHVADQLYRYHVPPLSLAETRKLLWSLPHLERYTTDVDVIDKVWRAVGGHPRCLEYLDALLGAGRGRFADITRRLTEAVSKRFDPQRAATWFRQSRTLDTALAEIATLAADDVLLTEHLTRLVAVPGAIRMLAGVSVYREPVDLNAVLFQVGTPDPGAATDQEALQTKIRSLLAGYGMDVGQVKQALAEESALSDSDRHQLAALIEQIRQPHPPIAPPPHMWPLLHQLVDTSLIIRTGDDRVFMHRWTASELEKRHGPSLGQLDEPDLLRQAHRGAAAYWRWRVEHWPQDRVADVHDLEEARYHLVAAGDLDAAAVLSERICSELHQRGEWDRESSLIHDTLRWLPSDSSRRPAWYHQLGRLAQLRGDYGEAERLYRQSLTILEELGNRAGIATSSSQLGVLYAETNRLTKAVSAHCRAFAMRVALGVPEAAFDLRELGKLRALLGEGSFTAVAETVLDEESVRELIDLLKRFDADE